MAIDCGSLVWQCFLPDKYRDTPRKVLIYHSRVQAGFKNRFKWVDRDATRRTRLALNTRKFLTVVSLFLRNEQLILRSTSRALGDPSGRRACRPRPRHAAPMKFPRLTRLSSWRYLTTSRDLPLPRNSPARRYITPVTSTADIWCLHNPKNPMRTAVLRMIRQTREQEILKFCIPVKKEHVQLDTINLCALFSRSF